MQMREYARQNVAVAIRMIHEMPTKKAAPLLFEGLSKFEVCPSGAGQAGPLKYAWTSGGTAMAFRKHNECCGEAIGKYRDGMNKE